MLKGTSARIHLYAAVPAAEASALEGSERGFSTITYEPVAAVVGCQPNRYDEAHAALRHDRIVGLACETCSSVIPFRLGTDFGSTDEIRGVLSLNTRELHDQLERFRGRVEMGLKVKLATPTADDPLQLPFGLDRVRSLAPEVANRSERLVQSGSGRTFDGCYLIPRWSVEDFWQALDGIRRLAPEMPLLGSGPWAAYSFCDVALRRGAEPDRSVPESR